MKYFFGTILFFISALLVAQQKPFVSNLSKTSGTVNETIIINGSNFPTNVSNVQVMFGTGKATVISASVNQLEVQVPNTATHGPVSVTDLTTGRSGVSSSFFNLSFGGDGFDVNSLDAQVDFPTGMQDTYDLCNCDFDGDGLTDVAVSNNGSFNISIYRNTSTTTSLSFQRINVNIGFFTINTECGDLNGDGRAELVFTKYEGDEIEQIFVYRNTSSAGSISFTKAAGFKLPFESVNRNARKILVADLDGDGIRDLVIGNETPETDNPVFVYRNQSATGISMVSTPVEIPVKGATRTSSIAIGDINQDGLQDIVSIPFDIANGSIFLMKNTSTPGSVSFSNEKTLSFPNTRIQVALGDYNNDGFLDIATTSSQNNEVEVFMNSASEDNFSFEDPIDLTVPRPWGLANADFDGDGLLDIVAASVVNGLYVAINNSTDQGVAFHDPVKISTTSTTRNVDAVDLNGDAKPDFAFTHDISSGAFGDLSVIANRNCLTPRISPSDQTFCSGNPFTLSATKSIGTTYTWAVVSGNASINPSGDEATVTVNSGNSVEISVTITADDGSCTNVGTQSFTLTGGSSPALPSVTNSNTGLICSGDEFTLSGPTGQSTYFWTLPNGAELDPQSTNTLTITNASSADAGIYSLRVQGTGCVSPAATISVQVNQPPSVKINNTGEDIFCEGGSTALEVPEYPGFTYQWRNESGNITGANQPTYTASGSGNYTVAVISPEGCENESIPYTLTEVAPPTSSFTSVDEICTGVSMDFTSDSQVEDYSPSYTWNFDDGSTGTGADTSHTFSAAGQYEVTLTTTYEDVASCSNTIMKPILVSDPPEELSVTTSSFEKCPADSIRLELPQGYRSYTWSTEDTDYFTYAKTAPGENEVIIDVDVVTEIGCNASDTYTVSNYANSQIVVSSSEATIVDDAINLESGVSTVALSASNGSEYSWEPADILKVSADGSSVVAYPMVRETVVSVTGIDAINGCETTASITIITPGVIPRKSFSPNGDGQGFDCWEILNTDNLQGCTVYVMDQRGRYVYKGDSPFANNCVWNGNADNGSAPAPEGIYYFVMKCDNSDFNRTGTILLAR